MCSYIILFCVVCSYIILFCVVCSYTILFCVVCSYTLSLGFFGVAKQGGNSVKKLLILTKKMFDF